ncbi:MAG: hypothetical protein IJ710_11285 [Prevotella sp.]|nr:hypothetical protein [Prevotella sp.]
MSYDIFQPVPQGSLGAQDAENSRIEAVANELRRRRELYEAQRRDSQQDINHLEAEQRVAEAFAKERGLWLPMENVFDLGTPGPSGNENDTYFSNDFVYKVNNLLNCGSILRLLEKVRMHNEIFPDTFYQLYAFTGFDGRTIMPILKQDFVKDAEPTPQIAIDTYMAAIGFNRQEQAGRYANETYIVWDLIPRNVLRDHDGDIFVVDAEIKRWE